MVSLRVIYALKKMLTMQYLLLTMQLTLLIILGCPFLFQYEHIPKDLNFDTNSNGHKPLLQEIVLYHCLNLYVHLFPKCMHDAC